METCCLAKDLMPLYIEGETNPETDAWMEAHLASCPDCKRIYDRMTTPMEDIPSPADVAYKKALCLQKKKNTRRSALLSAVVLIIGICAALLWMKGHGWFNVLERVNSPNGEIRTTVYQGSKSGLYFNDGFSVVEKGRFRGTSIYENAVYEGLWWSANSRYQLVSLYRDGAREMWLADFKRNNSANLASRLLSATYGISEFEDAVTEDSLKQIEFEFIGWDRYDTKMYFYYTFTRQDGRHASGHLWFDCETWSITDLVP